MLFTTQHCRKTNAVRHQSHTTNVLPCYHDYYFWCTRILFPTTTTTNKNIASWGLEFFQGITPQTPGTMPPAQANPDGLFLKALVDKVLVLGRLGLILGRLGLIFGHLGLLLG